MDDIEQLILALGSDDAREVHSATTELQKYGPDAVLPLIRTSENESVEPKVREQAVHILGLIRDDRAIEPLTNLLSTTPSHEIQQRVPIALRNIAESLIYAKKSALLCKAAEKIGPLLERSLNDKAVEYRVLTSHPPSAIASDLEVGRHVWAVNQNIAFRLTVIEVLRLIGSFSAIAAVTRQLSNTRKGQDDPQVLSAAIQALGNITQCEKIPQNKEAAIDVLTKVINNSEI
jgi:HEAT repeat protein